MTRRRAGILLVLAGAVALLRGGGGGGLGGELVWLFGLGVAAVVAWRLVLRRFPFGLRLVALLGFGIVGAATTDALSGPAFLGSLALAFALTYLTPTGRARRTGWALIPAGAIATLALVAAVDALRPRWDEGIFFLLGMTATFTAVYLLPRDAGGGRWALAPALVFAALTVLANDPTGAFARWAFPLALIGAGVAVLGWSRRRR